MSTKAIKDVDEHTWNRFKAGAASKGMDMAEYFGLLVGESEKYDGRKWWKDLLDFVEKNRIEFTDTDIKRMKAFRKRFKMRKF
ncbi:hypothetical protein HYX10_03985 [Candidatus Woesearchaeota archaeon]|nr:hypothetical protein [Candidatus Woesearchaeota archaeon]